jgi:hypothetical protein
MSLMQCKGLTLLYCSRKFPHEAASHTSIAEALENCTVMLYVMSERWAPAARYRDCLERLKALTLGLRQVVDEEPAISLGPPVLGAVLRDIGAQDSMQAVSDDRSPAHARANDPEIASTSVPDIIWDIAGDPFTLWEGETFSLNFEAFMPSLSDSAGHPWTGFGTSTSANSYQPDDAESFGQTDHYDFVSSTVDIDPTLWYTRN